MSIAKYNNPPLNEVVMGVKFHPIEGFHSQHGGLFWSQIKSDFPFSEQAPNLDIPFQSSKEVYPAPRFWFISQDRNQLIQLQNNIFYFNWRKVEGVGVYPDYDSVKAQFNKYFPQFKEYLKSNSFKEPEIIECQFSYINHLFQGKEWAEIEDIQKIMPSISFSQALEHGGGIHGLDMNFSYKLPDEEKGKHVIKIKYAVVRSTDQKIFVIENVAKGADPYATSLDEWFDYAHKHLVNTFENLMDGNIQKNLWGKR